MGRVSQIKLFNGKPGEYRQMKRQVNIYRCRERSRPFPASEKIILF